MKTRFHIVLLSCLIPVLSGCSQITKLPFLAEKPVTTIKPLKKVTAQLKTRKAWQVNTTSVMGNNKVHPYLDTRTVYVAGGVNASAWDSNTGELRWKTQIGEQVTAGVNGTLLANPQSRKNVKPLSSQILLGTSNGNAISLDARNGSIQWIERLTSEVLSVSAAENGRVVFRTADGKLHGLSSTTGELIWRRSQRTPSSVNLGASVPVIVSNIVVTGFDNGKIASYDLQTGQPIWEATLSFPSGNLAQDRIVDVDGRMKALGNALFASSINGATVGLNLQNGQQVWGTTLSSSSGVDVSNRGLFTSDTKGNLWSLNPQDGKPIWRLTDLVGRSPSVPMVINNSVLVVTDAQGNIHFLTADKAQYVARLTGDPSGYSVEPTISGKHIYVMGKSGLLSKISL